MALPISEIPQSSDPTILSDEQTHVIIKSLLDQLNKESTAMDQYRDYYDGDQELRYATSEFKRAFGDEFGDLVANWCEVAISATEDRLEMDRVIFRKAENEDIDEESSKAIWQVMLDNDIDELENNLYSSTMIEGRSAIIVWPAAEDDDQDVLLSVNRAQTIFVVYEENNPRRPQYAVKRIRTELGQVNITLYTQEWVYKYKVIKQHVEYTSDRSNNVSTDSSNWVKREITETGDPSWPLEQPFEQIPIIEFNARKNRSELHNLTPIQDAINKTLINMLVAADYAAQSQTYIISSNQEPDGGWKRRPGEVWQIQPEVDLDGKALPTSVGSIPAEDLGSFIKVIEHLLAQFSNLSSTPGYYIFNSQASGGRGDAPSGDSLKVSETTLTKKVEKYQQKFENSLVRLGKLIYEALELNGLVKGSRPDYGEVVWANSQKHFMGMLLEEGRKMIDELSLPPEYAWRHVGLSEAQIKEARKELDKQLAEQKALEQASAPNKDMDEAGIPRKTANQLSNGSTKSNT